MSVRDINMFSFVQMSETLIAVYLTVSAEEINMRKGFIFKVAINK